MAGQRHRDGDGLFIRVAVDLRLRNAGGQRAGLVEDDRVDLGQAFHRRSVLDHDPVLEQAPRGDDLDDGNGQTQRAGAGDDQHRDRDRDRPMPVACRRHPAEEGEQGGDVDDGRVECGSTVGDAAIARAASFGRFHQPYHLG